MSEPIVDIVEADAVITTECLLCTIDLKNVKACDLEFSAKYSVTATRNDYLHAIIGYFGVEFNCGRQKFSISTSPMREYTHWKQTVFYFEGVLPMNCGEEISGSFAIRRNPHNLKNLDIKISYHFNGFKSSFDEIRFYKLR